MRLALPTLRRIDEAPFVAGARADVDLVMTSTAIYPALSRLPAMLSRRISTLELRRRVGFTGVSITDDVTVRALTRFGSLRTLGRASLRAGNDLLLYCAGYLSAARAADGLVADVRRGRIDRAELRGSVARVLELRERLSRPAAAR